MVAKFRDETGTMELVWFKYSKWLKEQIPLNTEVVIFGRYRFSTMYSLCRILKLKNENKENSPTLLPVIQVVKTDKARD